MSESRLNHLRCAPGNPGQEADFHLPGVIPLIGTKSQMHTGRTFAGCGEKTIKSLADDGLQRHDTTLD